MSGDAFLETYRVHLDALGVDVADLHTDGQGTIRSRLREAVAEDLPELAGFAVGDTLGQGGMGLVSTAWQHALDREVAVKELRGGGGPGTTGRQALVHEARITGQLEHPNVVPIHDLGLSPRGEPMFAMKRIDGKAWSEWLAEPDADQRNRMAEVGGPLAFHVDVLIQVCHAVGFAHSRGILHRDLKPANVMIGHFGEVYLVDWGIAARLAELADGDPELVGTPAYMAPEMAAGRPLTVAADVYQLGAVLFELVAGHPPRPQATPMKTLAVAWSGEILPLPADAPAGLAAVVRRALAPEPADRYPSVAELQADLRDWLRNRPLLELADDARDRVRAAIAGLDPSAADARGAVREARDAAAALEPLRASLDDPGLDALRVELLSSLLDFEVRRDRPGAAETVLHELGDAATDDQRARVDAAVRAEAARAAELAKLRDQANWTYGRRLRQRYVVFLGVLQLVIYFPVWLLEVFVHGSPIEFPRTWLPGVGIPSLVALAALLMQRSGPAYDTLGSRTQRAIALMVVGSNLVFLTSLALDLDLRLAFFYTLSVGLGLPLAIQGVFTTPRFYPPAALFAVTGLAIALLPRTLTFLVLPLGVGLAHVAAWWTDSIELGSGDV